jgi:hypothetical protein
VRWRTALRQHLGELKLGYVVKNHVLLITSQDRTAKELVTVIYPVSELAMIRDWTGSQVPDLQSLIDVITSHVRPKSWSVKGGAGIVTAIPQRCALVISQTQEIHEEIAGLLQELWETSSPWGMPSCAPPSGQRGPNSPPQSGMGGGFF